MKLLVLYSSQPTAAAVMRLPLNIMDQNIKTEIAAGNSVLSCKTGRRILVKENHPNTDKKQQPLKSVGNIAGKSRYKDYYIENSMTGSYNYTQQPLAINMDATPENGKAYACYPQ
jgi:hypothetical protein